MNMFEHLKELVQIVRDHIDEMPPALVREADKKHRLNVISHYYLRFMAQTSRNPKYKRLTLTLIGSHPRDYNSLDLPIRSASHTIFGMMFGPDLFHSVYLWN